MGGTSRRVERGEGGTGRGANILHSALIEQNWPRVSNLVHGGCANPECPLPTLGRGDGAPSADIDTRGRSTYLERT